jgi:hypothetical protein
MSTYGWHGFPLEVEQLLLFEERVAITETQGSLPSPQEPAAGPDIQLIPVDI